MQNFRSLGQLLRVAPEPYFWLNSAKLTKKNSRRYRFMGVYHYVLEPTRSIEKELSHFEQCYKRKMQKPLKIETF